MNTSLKPSAIIQRFQGEKRQWKQRQDSELEEKVAVGRIVVADKFEGHCKNTSDSKQALALAWRDTMELSLKEKCKENDRLIARIRELQNEVAEWQDRTEEAENEVLRVEATDRLEEVIVAQSEVEVLKQHLESNKIFFYNQLQDKDIELEEARQEVVASNLRCRRLEEENSRFTAFFEKLEEQGGEIKTMAKQLQYEVLLRTDASKRYDDLSAKYESLACRFQVLAGEKVALQEQLSLEDQEYAPLVSLGTLERLGSPVGTLKRVSETEMEWRVADFFYVLDTAIDPTLLVSDVFEIEGLLLKFELSPKCGKNPPACFLFVKHARSQCEPRIAFQLSVGDQMFTSVVPLRPNEPRPWLDVEEVHKQIDVDGVITFSFDLIEVCRDEVTESEGKAVWYLGKERSTIYGLQQLSVGLSPLFTLGEYQHLQMECFPGGDEDSGSGCIVHVIMPSTVSTLFYSIEVSNVGEAHGRACASEFEPLQRHVHIFDIPCDDEAVTITIRELDPLDKVS